MTGLPDSRKRLVALILGFGVALAVVLFAATSGLGKASVPADAVAIVEDVDDGTITDAEYDRAIVQSAARLGLGEPPAPDSAEFQQVNDDAMQGLLLEVWAEGEAEDRGIEVTDTDVEDELTEIESSFQNEKEFARVVRQSKFCTDEEIDEGVPPAECADVIKQGRLLALQRKLSESFAADSEPEVTDADVEDFYDANPDLFETPATRSARVILNEDEAKVEQAQAELEGLSSEDEGFASAWKQAAKQYSQDQASKDRGGLLEGLVEGQGDPQLEEQVFAAAEGELVGPFETDRGFYLVQVVSSQEATTQPLEEASENIRQQLVAARQQATSTAVQQAFIDKWTARTVCEPEVATQLCSNFEAPEEEPIPGQPETPEPPPVLPTSPIEPGTATLSIDGTTQTGRPQGPQVPPPDPSEEAGGVIEGLPEGAVPVGPDGAPQTDGGTGADGATP